MNETELIASEIGHFIRPKQSKWKDWGEAIIGAFVIVAFTALLLWLASIGAF
ncbi:MAG TPA: hypothetical protein VKB38_13120 [Terracidiphilus sp.]|nr:hypothetical protein [Terracidiphilus sp.]